MSNLYADILALVFTHTGNRVESTIPSSVNNSVVQNMIEKLSGLDKKPVWLSYTLKHSIEFKLRTQETADALGLFLKSLNSNNVFSNYLVEYLPHKDGKIVNEPILLALDLTDLSTDRGRDGVPKKTLLNVMVTLFVDALKSPWIIDANIVVKTMNGLNYLIRSGLGLNSFKLFQQQLVIDVINTDYDALYAKYKSLYNDAIGIENATNEIKKLMGGEINLKHLDNNQDALLLADSLEYYRQQMGWLLLFGLLNRLGKQLGPLSRFTDLYGDNPLSSTSKLIGLITDYKSRKQLLIDNFTDYDKILSDLLVDEIVDLLSKVVDSLSNHFLELTNMLLSMYRVLRNALPERLSKEDLLSLFKVLTNLLLFYPKMKFLFNLLAQRGERITNLIIGDNSVGAQIRALQNQPGLGLFLKSIKTIKHGTGKWSLKMDRTAMKNNYMTSIFYNEYELLYNDPLTRELAIQLYEYSVIFADGSKSLRQLYNILPVSMLRDLGLVQFIKKELQQYKNPLSEHQYMGYMYNYLKMNKIRLNSLQLSWDGDTLPETMRYDKTKDQFVLLFSRYTKDTAWYYSLDKSGVYHRIQPINYMDERGNVENVYDESLSGLQESRLLLQQNKDLLAAQLLPAPVYKDWSNEDIPQETFIYQVHKVFLNQPGKLEHYNVPSPINLATKSLLSLEWWGNQVWDYFQERLLQQGTTRKQLQELINDIMNCN